MLTDALHAQPCPKKKAGRQCFAGWGVRLRRATNRAARRGGASRGLARSAHSPSLRLAQASVLKLQRGPTQPENLGPAARLMAARTQHGCPRRPTAKRGPCRCHLMSTRPSPAQGPLPPSPTFPLCPSLQQGRKSSHAEQRDFPCSRLTERAARERARSNPALMLCRSSRASGQPAESRGQFVSATSIASPARPRTSPVSSPGKSKRRVGETPRPASVDQPPTPAGS